MVWCDQVYLILGRENSVFEHLKLLYSLNQVHELMDNIKDFGDGKTKEAKTKGARRISLRACVAKAAGWTLENSNSTKGQEAQNNKAS